MGFRKIVVVLMALALLASACGGGDANGWTDDAKNELVAECTADGTPESQCQCLVDAATSEFTVEELTEDDVELTDEQAERMFELVTECFLAEG